jgi:hypothetical protein
MPVTVSASFSRFLQNISITEDHAETAGTRTKRIVDLLKDSFNILEAFPTGSLLRGTARKGIADVDVFVALHYTKHVKDKSPTAVLESIRETLKEYRVQMAKKNGQCVTLYFTTWPNVDIVPAVRVVDNGSFLHYKIPDSVRGVWIETNPTKHEASINSLTQAGRQRIRMMKAWNGAHSEFLQSFHIEVMELFAPEHTSNWPRDVTNFFQTAVNLIDSPLKHPNGASGNVDGYLDSNERKEAKKRLESALMDSGMAMYYSQLNKPRDAIDIYRRIFGSEFPAYG